MSAIDRKQADFWSGKAWCWRGLGVFLFLLCQSEHVLTAWSVPVLALAGAVAVWRGEFADEPGPDISEWAGLGFLLAMVISAALGVDAQRSLHLSSAVVPALLMYVLARRGQLAPLVWGLAFLIVTYWLRIIWAALHAPGQVPAEWIHAAAAPWLVVPNDWCWASMALPWLWWPRQHFPRWLAWILTIVVLGCAVWLQSRSALLCAVVAMLAALTLQGRWRRFKPYALTAVVLTLVILSLDAVNGFAFSGKFTRLLDTRLALWWSALQVFFHAPLTGVGPHNFVHVYQSYLPPAGGVLPVDTRLTPWPHQLPLEILAEMGLLGAASAGFWLLTLVRRYISLQHCAAITVAITASGAAFIFAALVESSFLRIWTWVMLVVILANLTQAPLKQIPPASVQSR